MKKNSETESASALSTADKIWEEIADKPLEIFALPAQIVKDHVQRLVGDPNVLTLKLNSSAVVTALENALNPNQYCFEQTQNGYVLIKRAPQIIGPKGILSQEAFRK